METGNQICHIQELNISKLAKDIIDSFGELAEQKSNPSGNKYQSRYYMEE